MYMGNHLHNSMLGLKPVGQPVHLSVTNTGSNGNILVLISYRSGRQGERPRPSGKGLAGDALDNTKTVDRHF